MIHTQPSVQYYAEQLLISWPDEDLDFVKSGEPDFGMIGRAIRNELRLWQVDHPLTTNWHSNPKSRKIIDGVDHSLDHPDNVSNEILVALRKMIP